MKCFKEEYMGVDWIRIRLRAGTTPEALAALVQTQAASFRQMPQFWDVSPRLYFPDDEEHAPQTNPHMLKQYVESSRALRDAFDVGEGSDAFPASWRVSVITRNMIFPSEWRQHAYRTYLPNESPRQLAVWYDYIAAARQGRNQRYLYLLFLSCLSKQVYDGWVELLSNARRSREITAAWATKPAFVAVRKEIEQMKPPPLYPSVWTFYRTRLRYPTAEDEERCREYSEQMESIIKLTHAWDAQVRQTWKLRRYRQAYTATFEQFLEQANDPWLADFFAWVDRCCIAEMGLLLDY
jgi:hypothetical protein